MSNTPRNPQSIGREEAVRLAETKWWLDVSQTEAWKRQMQTVELMMPFGVFQEAADVALGRPVFTHEFAKPDLLWEEFWNKDKS